MKGLLTSIQLEKKKRRQERRRQKMVNRQVQERGRRRMLDKRMRFGRPLSRYLEKLLKRFSMESLGIKKVGMWIKSMVYKIADLIPDRFKRHAEHVPTELEEELAKKIQKRAKEGRSVDTRQGGPNMPRYQFCDCGRRVKRAGKTMGGAYYKCPIHGKFFVKFPR